MNKHFDQTRNTAQLLAVERVSTTRMKNSRQDVVDADNAVRPGGPAVVHNGGVALNPDPTTRLGQEAVVLSGDLTFDQH